MRRRRAALRNRYGGGRRAMWRVWLRGKDMGVVMAKDHGEAMRKARKALEATTGIEVEAVE